MLANDYLQRGYGPSVRNFSAVPGKPPERFLCAPAPRRAPETRCEEDHSAWACPARYPYGGSAVQAFHHAEERDVYAHATTVSVSVGSTGGHAQRLGPAWAGARGPGGRRHHLWSGPAWPAGLSLAPGPGV